MKHLCGGGVLGHSLGALRHGMLGELAGKKEPDGGLDLSGRERLLSAVPRERDRFCGEAVKRVLDERVHDAHRTAGDSRLGVHLLEHLVDVAREGLDTPLAALVATRLLGGRLGGGFAGSFGHFDIFGVCLVS